MALLTNPKLSALTDPVEVFLDVEAFPVTTDRFKSCWGREVIRMSLHTTICLFCFYLDQGLCYNQPKNDF